MNYLFDIGNVLLLLDFPSFHRRVFGPDGPSPGVTDRLAALKDPYETGKLSDEDFITQTMATSSSTLSRAEFTAAWNEIFAPNPPMWELVEQLKKEGHRLILFSNTNALHADYFLREFEIFKHFGHHHFSHEAGAIKPDDSFYTTAIEEYGLTPSKTRYFDDLPENIETGKRLGFLCHQYDFNNHQAALDWLEKQP